MQPLTTLLPGIAPHSKLGRRLHELLQSHPEARKKLLKEQLAKILIYREPKHCATCHCTPLSHEIPPPDVTDVIVQPVYSPLGPAYSACSLPPPIVQPQGVQTGSVAIVKPGTVQPIRIETVDVQEVQRALNSQSNTREIYRVPQDRERTPPRKFRDRSLTPERTRNKESPYYSQNRATRSSHTLGQEEVQFYREKSPLLKSRSRSPRTKSRGRSRSPRSSWNNSVYNARPPKRRRSKSNKHRSRSSWKSQERRNQPAWIQQKKPSQPVTEIQRKLMCIAVNSPASAQEVAGKDTDEVQEIAQVKATTSIQISAIEGAPLEICDIVPGTVAEKLDDLVPPNDNLDLYGDYEEQLDNGIQPSEVEVSTQSDPNSQAEQMLDEAEILLLDTAAVTIEKVDHLDHLDSDSGEQGSPKYEAPDCGQTLKILKSVKASHLKKK